MIRKPRVFTKLLLFAIFSLYCAITTFCIHTHFVDGAFVVHYHPYNDSPDENPHNHNGNKLELILFSAQSSFNIGNIEIEEWKLNPVLACTDKPSVVLTQEVVLRKNKYSHFLRPPPTCYCIHTA